MDNIQQAETHIQHYQYELAAVEVAIAQARATERQAAALERIADDTRTMALIIERAFDPDKDYIHIGDAALERIAAVLESTTNKGSGFWSVGVLK